MDWGSSFFRRRFRDDWIDHLFAEWGRLCSNHHWQGLQDQNLRSNLTYIDTNCSILPIAIEKLQARGMVIVVCVGIIQNIDDCRNSLNKENSIMQSEIILASQYWRKKFQRFRYFGEDRNIQIHTNRQTQYFWEIWALLAIAQHSSRFAIWLSHKYRVFQTKKWEMSFWAFRLFFAKLLKPFFRYWAYASTIDAPA